MGHARRPAGSATQGRERSGRRGRRGDSGRACPAAHRRTTRTSIRSSRQRGDDTQARWSRRPRRHCRWWRGSLQPPLDDEIDGWRLGSPDAERGRAGLRSRLPATVAIQACSGIEDAAARSAECAPSRADCSARSRARTAPCRARTPATATSQIVGVRRQERRSRVTAQVGAQERGAHPRLPEVRPRRQPLDDRRAACASPRRGRSARRS